MADPLVAPGSKKNRETTKPLKNNSKTHHSPFSSFLAIICHHDQMTIPLNPIEKSPLLMLKNHGENLPASAPVPKKDDAITCCVDLERRAILYFKNGREIPGSWAQFYG